MIGQVVAVAAGGALGAAARYGITRATAQLASFPFGTLVSNVAAGLAIGLLIGSGGTGLAASPRLKLFLVTGVLGGLSTFSTFSIETVAMFEAGAYAQAAANVLLNNILCFAAVAAGFWLRARLVHP